MNFFTIATPVTYWILIILWTCILAFYIKRLRSNVHRGQLIFVLISILAVDAFRTLFESFYFGAWYTSLAGFLPEYVYTFLVRPEMVFIPKIINVIAAGIVLALLIYRWLPKEHLEKENFKNLIKKRTYELKKSNENLQQEIKEHKKTAEALLKSEKKYKWMIANISDVIGIMGEGGIIQYTSPNIEKWFGWHPQDLIGTDGWVNVHPDDLVRVKNEYHGIFEGDNATRTAEYRYKCKDGTYKWIQLTATNFIHDPILKGVLMNYHDITERKQSEEAFQKKNEQLRAIFETAINVSFIITDARDPEPIMLEFSPGAEKIFGYGKDEMLGNSISILHLPEDVKKFAQVHQQMREGKIGFSGETTLVKKSGSKFSALFSTHPLFDSKGHMYAALGVCMDISRQKQLESRIRQTHKMESIGILAGGIAHDFNNILFPLIGYAEMLQEDLPQGSLEQTNSSQILQAALRARDLVKQILTFSQKSVPELKAVRLQTILSEAITLLCSSFPKTIEMKTKVQTENCIVVADPTQLHQVIMNLGTNAYHAMQTSGGKLNISLNEIEVGPMDSPDLTPGRYALLRFVDTGTGIKKEIAKKIFDPYFTTKEIGKGSGLGLSVALGIVKSCDGDIVIDSEHGKGTQVDVYLPLIKKGIEHKSFDLFKPIQGGSEIILLVDDEESIITMEGQMLQRLGYTVRTSNKSLEALEVFKANPGEFDLMITDMTMPNLTGVQLAQKIHKIRRDIPIIICTGFSDQINEESCEEMGIQGFILKPIIRSEMAHKIRKVLALSRLK